MVPLVASIKNFSTCFKKLTYYFFFVHASRSNFLPVVIAERSSARCARISVRSLGVMLPSAEVWMASEINLPYKVHSSLKSEQVIKRTVWVDTAAPCNFLALVYSLNLPATLSMRVVYSSYLPSLGRCWGSLVQAHMIDITVVVVIRITVGANINFDLSQVLQKFFMKLTPNCVYAVEL